MIMTEQKCPCNSGKKMKDCCFSKKNITLEKHWTAIKGRVLQTFISEHPTEKEIDLIHQWVGIEKMAQFEEKMDAATLQHLLIDAYFFTENRTEWGYHLIKNMREIVQPRTHTILASWQNPYYFIGTVQEVVDEFVIAKHIWTDEVIYLADVDVEDPIQDDILIGHIIPGVNPHFYNLLSSAIVLAQEQAYALDLWLERFNRTSYNNLEYFFQHELLNCLYDLVAETTVHNNQDADVDLDALQLIINLDILLIDLDLKSDRLTLIFFNYLMGHINSLNIRKQIALVGAIIDFGMRYDFIPKVITQKSLSEKLGVSTATIVKYSRKIGLYFDQDFDVAMLDKIRQPVYEIGTDATEKEYSKWQLERNIDKMVFTTPLEKKRMEKKLLQTPFKARSHTDKAQKYVYEAYLAENTGRRLELAQLAYMHDAHNLDANLILQEQEHAEQRLKLLENPALYRAGKMAEARYILLKVTLLYYLHKYEEAYAVVKNVSPALLQKNQVLNYFYCLLHYMFGQEAPLRDFLNGTSEDTAVKQWLLWLVAKEANDEHSDLLHLNCVQVNPFVQKYIEFQMQPAEFPTHLNCVKGDPNEAKMVHFLVYPFLK